MSEQFTNKVFVITGAASGIGRATAIKLSAKGATLALCDVNAQGLQETSESCTSKYTINAFDVGNSKECKAVVAETFNISGRIDGVFNCAGINPTNIPTAEVTDEYYDKMMDCNVRGLFNMTRAAIPVMKKGGVFVNTSSICGVQGGSGFAVYCATKHAIIGFSKSIALELGPLGIRTNIIAPGYIHTPSNVFVLEGEAAVESNAQSCALKRMGTAEEIANVVAFLFSDESNYMNGAVVQIDGGM